MEFKELLKFVEITEGHIARQYNLNEDNEKKILAVTVKLTEELGELCNEVLSFNSLQRKQKLDNHDKENLPDELADVLLTTLILAKTMDIDVEKALKKKMKKINKRYE